MRIAPEGWPFIAAFWILEFGFVFFGFTTAAIAWLPVAVWVVAFFRDPVRVGPRGDNLVIAPADGLVVSVRSIDEPDFHGGEVQRVSIFMNVFNVHVNRYPVNGTIAYRKYTPGAFVNAAAEKASIENEQSSVGIVAPRGKVLVRQIAGLVARRIITDHGEGTAVRQGERMGLIRFGSRVDVFLPKGATIRVAEGERTVAGVSIIAEWP
ncbi:MAG TPA: phosphatidylserine decarboxylase family protein [Gemmatimonadales bacterium]|nr:phosphatidylserine decarboxylase family protein [Gemmatimonadales bacterium]HRZ09580.1 phosphatidylserine decarboxylase family protein [Gemmatimonadales bacterium]